jgi:hypothetical protein
MWVEKYWYRFWEERKYFHPDAAEALKTDKRYIMVIPPPKSVFWLTISLVSQGTCIWAML